VGGVSIKMLLKNIKIFVGKFFRIRGKCLTRQPIGNRRIKTVVVFHNMLLLHPKRPHNQVPKYLLNLFQKKVPQQFRNGSFKVLLSALA
jgi:hypothetical protein